MTERERLIRLLSDCGVLCNDCGDYGNSYCIEAIADYLIKNGVIVPPCKVGDTVWVIWQGFDGRPKTYQDRVWHFTVYSDGIGYETDYLDDGVYGVNLFSTREEAEKAKK